MVHIQETQNIDAFENDDCDVLFYIVINCVKAALYAHVSKMIGELRLFIW